MSGNDWCRILARAVDLSDYSDAEIDQSLQAMDQEISVLADALRVEYVGPDVDIQLRQDQPAFKLVVRHHIWDIATAGWGVKICDALPQAHWRVMWPVYGVSRLRKRKLLSVLPRFFAGYAASVVDVGAVNLQAVDRLEEISGFFAC